MAGVDLAFPRHVYIHVPFCARRCSYCDFSIAVRRETPIDEFVQAVAAEIDLRFLGRSARHWHADTVYLGGGTPSRLGASGIRALLDMLRQRLTIAAHAEITIEANPEDVSLEAARTWRDAGVNRASLGAQSFDSRALEWMRRTHGSDQICRAVDTVRAVGIENVSLDLIFALPATLGRVWRDDVGRAIALEPQHISLYGLTIHERTPLSRWRERGEITEAPDEAYAEDFLLAHDMLTEAGFDHYEVSNYARPGMRSRHNSCYWLGIPWAGIGPAAHEFDGARRRWNVGPYAQWVRAVRGGQDPIEGEEVLSTENRNAERVYLGLRTSEGLVLTEREASRVRPWIDSAWATVEGARLRLTPEGWLRLDALAASLT
jgi:oxygen-independent coproporphyrinogen-3 oxidase